MDEGDLPSEFYLCYECLGNGQLASGSTTHLCNTCKGVGRLGDDHKYVQRMHQLYQLHFSPKDVKKNSKEVEKPSKQVEKDSKEIPLKTLDKAYEVLIAAVAKKDVNEVNKIFTMRFEIKNEGQHWRHENIQVIECGKTEGKRVSALKSGDKMVVELGPFVCRDQTVLEKTYSLFYKEEDQLVRFGHKFGFAVKGVKKAEIKKNDSIEKEQEKIRDLKAISGSLKSEEYLGLKLKSLGIDLLDVQLEEEMLVDIVRQIK